jgi:uncharacterized membrane protein
MDLDKARKQTRTAGILLGLGLGGFVDGFALHQIAQWHNMLSARVPPTSMEAMQTNMTADGWFHAGVFALTLAGVLLLYSSARGGPRLTPMRWFLGLLIGGWGAFNLVEGIINHHLLQLRDVRDMPVHMPVYDYAFLLVGGLGFLAIGWLLTRGAGAHAPSSRASGAASIRTVSTRRPSWMRDGGSAVPLAAFQLGISGTRNQIVDAAVAGAVGR